MATVTFTKLVKNRLSATNITDHNSTMSSSTEQFIDEPYPKTCLQKFPSIMFEHPLPRVNNAAFRSRRTQRFRTQPVTLTEIQETDEENKIDTDQRDEFKPQVSINYDPFHHLALEENIRHSARTRLPLKSFLKQQRLKATPEELRETDGN